MANSNHDAHGWGTSSRSPEAAAVPDRAGQPGGCLAEGSLRDAEVRVGRAPHRQQRDASDDDRSRHEGIRASHGPRRFGLPLLDRDTVRGDQRREGGHGGERPPRDPTRRVGADDEEEAEPQQRRPRRGLSAAREVRRDEHGGPVEQDPRDVAQRGRLPFADQARHRRVRPELRRVDPDGWAERRQATGDRGHHRDGQREVAARRALCHVCDPGKPEHGRRQEEAAVDVRPKDGDRDDEPQAAGGAQRGRRRGGASARTAPWRSAGDAGPSPAPRPRMRPAPATPRVRTPVPWRRHSSKIVAAISPTRAARKSTSPVHPATR